MIIGTYVVSEMFNTIIGGLYIHLILFNETYQSHGEYVYKLYLHISMWGMRYLCMLLQKSNVKIPHIYVYIIYIYTRMIKN